MKFYPHAVGTQSQSVTFDTAKDCIVQNVQKTCDCGIDIAELLEKESSKDLTAPMPVHSLSVNPDADAKKQEQEGFDMTCKAEIEEHIERKLKLEQNKTKAHALVCSNHCN